MRAHHSIWCALIIVLSLPTAFAQVAQSKPMPAVVNVQIDPNGNLGSVSPYIFGSFLEPIDYSINNGVMRAVLEMEPGFPFMSRGAALDEHSRETTTCGSRVG